MKLVGEPQGPGDLAMGHVGEPEQGGGRLESPRGAERRWLLADLRGEVTPERVVAEARLGGDGLQVDVAGEVVGQPRDRFGDIGGDGQVGRLVADALGL